jgi:hypothetical protein
MQLTHPHLPSTVTVAEMLPVEVAQGRSGWCAGTVTSAPASSSHLTMAGSNLQAAAQQQQQQQQQQQA